MGSFISLVVKAFHPEVCQAGLCLILKPKFPLQINRNISRWRLTHYTEGVDGVLRDTGVNRACRSLSQNGKAVAALPCAGRQLEDVANTTASDAISVCLRNKRTPAEPTEHSLQQCQHGSDHTLTMKVIDKSKGKLSVHSRQVRSAFFYPDYSETLVIHLQNIRPNSVSGFGMIAGDSPRYIVLTSGREETAPAPVCAPKHT